MGADDMNRLEYQAREVIDIARDQKPSRKWLQRAGFVGGALVGGYLGYELAESARFLSRAGAFEYVINQHPYLTQMIGASVGAIGGNSFAKALQTFLAPTTHVLSEARDEALGIRRNGHR